MKIKTLSHGIHDKNECVHYCSVGGHFWTHETERGKTGIASCPYRLDDRQEGKSVVKFFYVCERHQDKPSSK